MTKSPPPTWMLPTPREETRTLNGQAVRGWAGFVPLEEIRYWPENRRTEADLASLRRHNKSAVLDDDMVYTFLVDDPDLGIESLARDIMLNGLRAPLILSYDKTLLDGNRRYLAHRWIVEHGNARERTHHAKVPVWVLSEEDSDSAGRRRVITQYNFLTDFRREWSDLVKAKFLYDEYTDSKNNYTLEDLYQMYGGPGFSRNKIREFVKTYEVVALYLDYCEDEDDALITADEHFIWFQQLQRSYSDLIRNDDEFREAIFKNLRGGFIGTTDDLKNLKDVRKYHDAWAQFKKGEVKTAHFQRMIHQHDEEQQTAPDTRLSEINSRLYALLEQTGLVERASQENRDRFHELAALVPGQIGDVNLRVASIVRQLQTISSQELASLSDELLSELEGAMDQVIRQAQATRV